MTRGMRTIKAWSIMFGACLFVGVSILGAGQAPGKSSATRANLAAAYLRFETAFLGSSLDEAETVRVNRAFDALTLMFFSRNYSGAIKQLDELTGSLQPGGTGALITDLGPYLVRITPAVYVAGKGKVSLAVEMLYPPARAMEEISATLRLQPDDSRHAIDLPVEMTIKAGAPIYIKTDVDIASKNLKPGRYAVGFTRDDKILLSGTWSVVSRSLDARSTANAARLAKVTASSPALAQALAATTSRNALLTDTPDPDSTAQMLFDPEVLAAEVEMEIKAVDAGKDPFKNRAGDYWRVLKTDAGNVPLRVYLSKTAPRNEPLPLVIAFHGAGGDENMFMDAYGGGLIKRLADKHGFLVVSPFANAFAGPKSADTFDRLVEALGYDYAIDSKRIYVLGHSMGGMAVSGLIAVRADRIAAAACINGFSGFKDDVKAIPPTLVTAGELDPLIRPASIDPLFSKAKAAGLPVEYRLLKNYGHTLAVTKLLPDVIAWLLARTR
jgi:predicted esterase